MQKVRYIHANPVEAGLVSRVEDFRFSSARVWNGKSLESEPILVDKVDWREAKPPS